jgi:hypothetical protein
MVWGSKALRISILPVLEQTTALPVGAAKTVLARVGISKEIQQTAINRNFLCIFIPFCFGKLKAHLAPLPNCLAAADHLPSFRGIRLFAFIAFASIKPAKLPTCAGALNDPY